MRKIKIINRKKKTTKLCSGTRMAKAGSARSKTGKKSKHDRLDRLREQILTTSWHPLQTESYVKQLFVELIDALKEKP
jgi:hypothetical protein